MNEPIDYGEVGEYLNTSRGLSSVEIKTPYHSTWLDNTKAKLLLGWHPRYDMQKMVNSAFDYVREETDPRNVWYPG
jgi:nucleoside-diphosphate-sugar epimerase